MRRVAAWMMFIVAAGSVRAEIIDRIAITVGKKVIAESEILRDLRVAAFIDGRPLDLSVAAKRRSAGRLVDQILILQELADSHVTLSVDEDVAKAIAQIKAQFGSASAYETSMAGYGITEKDVADQLAAGLRALRFSDLRFSPQVQISEKELRDEYDRLSAGKGQMPSFEDSSEQVRQLLTQMRLSDALDAWLAMTRNDTLIVYRPQVIP